MKSEITIFLLLISILSFGQKKDSIKLKEVELAEKLTYTITSNVFKEQKYNSKLDKEYKLPWDNDLYTEKQIKVALDTLIKNATIKIKKEG